MIRSEALRVLKLEGTETEKEITKKYRQLALKLHPDKPTGSKEAFQKLANAYEVVLSKSQEAASSSTKATASSRKRKTTSNTSRAAYDDTRSEEEYEEEQNWGDFYDFHYNFFSTGYSSHFGGHSDEHWEEYFHQQRDTARRRYERQRRENLRQGYDHRDRRGSFMEDICSFCGTNAAIEQSDAEEHGINWEEFSQHPEGYRTCWICKNKHISVMTENMAITKFAKKLEPKRDGPYGEYRFTFWILRKEDRSFHHQPKTAFYDGPTRNSVYYWYPDLEDAALALGWQPRGKKKEEVPWRRKDYPNAIVHVQPSTPRKKRKKKAAKVTP